MRKWLSNWPYSDLEEKLIYKCRIEVRGCDVYQSEQGFGARYISPDTAAMLHADVNAASFKFLQQILDQRLVGKSFLNAFTSFSCQSDTGSRRPKKKRSDDGSSTNFNPPIRFLWS